MLISRTYESLNYGFRMYSLNPVKYVLIGETDGKPLCMSWYATGDDAIEGMAMYREMMPKMKLCIDLAVEKDAPVALLVYAETERLYKNALNGCHNFSKSDRTPVTNGEKQMAFKVAAANMFTDYGVTIEYLEFLTYLQIRSAGGKHNA